jgi:hypothetical protein
LQPEKVEASILAGANDRVVCGKLQARGIEKPAWQSRKVRANDHGRLAAFESEGQHPFHALAEIS